MMLKDLLPRKYKPLRSSERVAKLATEMLHYYLLSGKRFHGVRLF